MRDADAKTLLTVYLQDHHAGSVGGIELAKRCAEQNTQEPPGGLLRTFVESLQVTGLAREVMAHLDIAPSPVKSPMALVAERVGRAELNGQLVGYSPLSRLEELEALSAGVETQHNLWRTLKALPRGSIPTTSIATSASHTQEQRRPRAAPRRRGPHRRGRPRAGFWASKRRWPSRWSNRHSQPAPPCRQVSVDTCGCAATTACPLWAASPLAGAAHNHGCRARPLAKSGAPLLMTSSPVSRLSKS